MTSEIKKSLLEKAKIYRIFVKSGRTLYEKIYLHNITIVSATIIKDAKGKCLYSLGSKLNDHISTKQYWSILHSFLSIHKIPHIVLISHNITFITSFLNAISLFNNIFASQCTTTIVSTKLTTILCSCHQI